MYLMTILLNPEYPLILQPHFHYLISPLITVFLSGPWIPLFGAVRELLYSERSVDPYISEVSDHFTVCCETMFAVISLQFGVID